MPEYQHKEAFCLMWYKCQGLTKHPPPLYQKIQTQSPCGHMERIWNSRDGVTPFVTTCPSCGGDLQHVYFGSDKCVADHVPHPGQKIWRNITVEDAKKMRNNRIEYMRRTDPRYIPTDPKEFEGLCKSLFDSIYQDGLSPWLDSTPW